MGLKLNEDKCALWARDAAAVAPPGRLCALSVKGLKILGSPVGEDDFVNCELAAIEARCCASLARVVEADLPLQHRALLLRVCAAQEPTFWTRTVPGAGGGLQKWDDEVRKGVERTFGVPVEAGSALDALIRLPDSGGRLGLRSAVEVAPRAFAASVLWAAQWAQLHPRGGTFPCSPPRQHLCWPWRGSCMQWGRGRSPIYGGRIWTWRFSCPPRRGAGEGPAPAPRARRPQARRGVARRACQQGGGPSSRTPPVLARAVGLRPAHRCHPDNPGRCLQNGGPGAAPPCAGQRGQPLCCVWGPPSGPHTWMDLPIPLNPAISQA